MNITELLARGIRYIKKNGLKRSVYRAYEKIVLKYFKKVQNAFDIEEANSYKIWIKNNEPNKRNLKLQKHYKFEYRPKISIVVPMYNTKERYLKDLVESIMNQTYDNWELCLADGSTKELKYIDKIIVKDPRIKYKRLEGNKGISGNSNAALELTSGDYIALLDHDDILPIFSLHEIAKTINENKEAQFIYTDEDKIMEYKGYRLAPHFKPNFAPDNLRTCNYICHFSIFKKDLMDKLGGFNSEFDGSQDYDLILRATELTDKIVHIPKILYHWRMNEDSVAMNSSAKPYAYIAAKKAIEASLKRQNINAEVVNSKTLGLYRIVYKIEGNPKVSIIIPNKDNVEYLKKCIDSIKKSTYNNYEILIVENNSQEDKTFLYYQTLKYSRNIIVLYYNMDIFNYPKLNNYGVKNMTGEYIVLLNNDIEILTPDWMENMLGICQREDVGAVGGKLIFPNNRIQHVGVVLGLTGPAGHISLNTGRDDLGYMGRTMMQQNFTAITGAMLMVSKENYINAGMLSEDFAVSFNDTDFCLKLREMGKLNVYDPYVEAIHYESRTRGYEDTDEKRQRFENESQKLKDKWKNYFDKEDEYFNINFRHDIPIMRIRRDSVFK